MSGESQEPKGRRDYAGSAERTRLPVGRLARQRGEIAAATKPQTEEQKPNQRRARLNIEVTPEIEVQIRRRMVDLGFKSYKSYILHVLRESGEIEASDEDISDRRGEWMKRRGNA